MKPAISIQIIWPIAANEAIAGKFENIEPSHLFLGALKFAELEVKHFRQMVEDLDATKELVAERDAIRDKLQEHSIFVPDTSTPIRRGLRKRLGKGGFKHEREKVIHRSDASRQVCHAAEDAAQLAGESHWNALHLIDELLSSPGSIMASVLAQAGAKEVKPPANTPLLDKYGRDLTDLAAKGRLDVSPKADSDPMKDPVCKVIVNEILGPKKSNILLVRAGQRPPKEVIEMLARLFVSESPPKGSKGLRIIEISISKVIKGASSPEKLEERLSDLFKEASMASNVILCLYDIHRYLSSDTDTNISDVLKETLTDLEIQVLTTTDEENYIEHIKPDSAWKRLFQVVWIHDLDAPLQL